MVQQNEEVNFQGRKGRVTSVMGNEPNQAVSIRFDDNTERVVMVSELQNAAGAGMSGSKLNEEQIAGHGGQDRDRIKGRIGGPQVDNSLPGKETKPVPTPYTNKNPDYQRGMSGTYADVTEPPLEGGEPTPPLGEGDGGTKPIDPDADTTPNDSGPGTGDTGAGLKADGKDVDSPRRRLLGTEEIVTYIEPVTRKIVDRNGRKLEVGTTISLKARLIKFHGADKVEVLYPPYVNQSQIPIWSSERNRLELPSQDDPSKGNGSAYEGMMFSYKDGQVVDANGNEVKQPELEKQEKITVPVKYVEKF